jgi:nitrate/TMAO reductase-like tetraheme cytochrome c subunit
MNQSFPTKYEVKLAQKRWTGSSRQSLLEGSDLYVNNCGRCHEYYAPKAYSEEEWTDILHKMARKSHLEETQEETLRRYVLTKMTADNAKPAAH